ncbi:hypothetical protein OF83DRAFT_609972 [Amylostereum chailletii]|nr:hypothetical protein OF83DRAFT_609972 [Amylostereum chailletii]
MPSYVLVASLSTGVGSWLTARTRKLASTPSRSTTRLRCIDSDRWYTSSVFTWVLVPWLPDAPNNAEEPRNHALDVDHLPEVCMQLFDSFGGKPDGGLFCEPFQQRRGKSGLIYLSTELGRRRA